MTQKSRTLWALVFLFSITAVIATWAFRMMSSSVAGGPVANEPTLIFAPKQSNDASEHFFHRIEIRTANETSILERSPSQKWRLTSPVASSVDDYVVAALARELVSARFQAKVEEAPSSADLSRYGLNPAQLTLVATMTALSNTPQQLIVRVGVENPYDGSVYLQKDGDPAVYSAPGGFRLALNRNSYELRNKAVSQIEAKQLQRLQLSFPFQWTLEMKKPGEWEVLGTQRTPADSSLVKSILNSIANERALAFFDTTSSSSKLVEATLTSQTEETERLTCFGRPADETCQCVRENNGVRSVFETPVRLVKALAVTEKQLKVQRLLMLLPEDIERLEFRFPNQETAVYSRFETDAGVSENWVSSPHSPGSASTARISHFLWNFLRLRPVKEPLPSQPPKSASVVLEIILHARTPKGARNSIRFYQPVDDTSDVFWVQLNQGPWLQVELTSLLPLPTSPKFFQMHDADGGR